MNLFIFNYIFKFSNNPYIASIALFLSYYLVIAVIAVLIIWAMFFATKKMYSFSLLFLTGLSAFMLSNILKIIFLVNRPSITWHEIIPLVQADGFSFPSTHSVLMAGLAMAGFYLYKKLGIVLAILAILVGISRIVLGVHYPLDVVGGWALGCLISFLFTRVFKKL